MSIEVWASRLTNKTAKPKKAQNIICKYVIFAKRVCDHTSSISDFSIVPEKDNKYPVTIKRKPSYRKRFIGSTTSVQLYNLRYNIIVNIAYLWNIVVGVFQNNSVILHAHETSLQECFRRIVQYCILMKPRCKSVSEE